MRLPRSIALELGVEGSEEVTEGEETAIFILTVMAVSVGTCSFTWGKGGLGQALPSSISV